MNKNNKTKKKAAGLRAVFASKGFYIALMSLTMVVGTVAVVRKFTSGVSQSLASFDDEAWEKATLAAEENNKEQEKEEDVFYVEDDWEEEPQPKLTEETVTASKELSEDELIASLSMSAPCGGEISRKYSPDRLIYSETTDDWRTHQGIDIAAEEGTVVIAAADGVIEEVYEDKALGIVVVAAHEGNVRTLYANLQDLGFIEVGRKVAKGDAVGAVGKSALSEKKETPHLHFEIIKDGENQNPSKYIPL